MFPCLIEPYEDVLRTSSGRHQDMMSSGGPRDVILRSGQYTSRLNFATFQYTFLNRSFTYNVRNNFQVEQCCSKKNPIFFVVATEKKSNVVKRGIIVADIEVVYDPGRFISAGQRTLSRRCHDDIKVWLVQSQDSDVRLISQIDIVMCFIYNISAMPWQY